MKLFSEKSPEFVHNMVFYFQSVLGFERHVEEKKTAIETSMQESTSNQRVVISLVRRSIQAILALQRAVVASMQYYTATGLLASWL